MAKSAPAARGMWRFRKRTWVPEQAYELPGVFMVGPELWAKLLHRGMGLDPRLPGNFGLVSKGIVVNEHLAAYWRDDGHTLRGWAGRYLRRHAQRRRQTPTHRGTTR